VEAVPAAVDSPASVEEAVPAAVDSPASVEEAAGAADDSTDRDGCCFFH
jgi:hypothetical protein